MNTKYPSIHKKSHVTLNLCDHILLTFTQANKLDNTATFLIHNKPLFLAHFKLFKS